MFQDSNFKKSSFSENHGDCVEVASPGSGAAIRDSKSSGGAPLEFEGAALPSLLGKIKTGALDLHASS